MKIIQKENLLLRKRTKEVPLGEIKSPKMKKIIASLKRALEKEEDGVAIAAPQIGLLLSIFVVSRRVFEIIKDMEGQAGSRKAPRQDLVFINPKISRLSKNKEWVEEGCLSVRWLYGKVRRAKKAKIVAWSERGIKFEMGASGLLAQVFQHECDHLEGKLFIDKAKEVRELSHEEITEIKKVK